MGASDDLFQLIKSMSRSEKGYFKKYASKHTIGGKNSYVKLFDAIDAQAVYDEDALKRKFKNDRFVSSLYSTKNYLFNLTLKSLSAYHSEKYAVSKLNNMLTELNVLFEKGLYKQFRTLLNKAIEIAKKNDKMYYLAILYNKELTYVATDYYASDNHLEFSNIKNRTLDTLERLKVDEEYHIIYNELFLFSKQTGSVRNIKDLEKLNAILDNPIMKDEKYAVNFDAKFKYYSIWGHYYRILNDTENWYRYRKALLELMESDEKYIRENPRSYVLALNNYLNVCIAYNRAVEFAQNLQKLKKYSEQFENKKEFIDLHTRIFLLVSDLELSFAIKTGRADKLSEIVEQIEHGFARYEKLILENRKTSLYNRIAYACFLTGEYEKSIFYTNRIMNAANPRLDPEQYILARIRSLIVHFEAGNYELLEYSIKSTMRFLKKTDRVFKFEKLILNFLAKAVMYENDSERIELYEKLKVDINKISNDQFEKNVLEQFDFISWINSKLLDTEMLKVLKKKAV